MKKQFLKIVANFILIGLVSVNCMQTAKAQVSPATDTQKMNITPEQRVEMRVSRMKQNLNLTDDQASKVKQLLLQQEAERMANKGEAKGADNKPMMDGLAKILTPEQMTKFSQMRSRQQGQKMPQSPSENK